MGNRRNSEVPRWLDWFGDMSAIRIFLINKPWWSPWLPVKLINAVVRSFGVVTFANNPLTGVLIVAGMFAGDCSVASMALICAAVGVVCSKAIGAPNELVCDGVTAFNSLLVGAVGTAVVPSLLDFEVRWPFYLIVVAASVITCYVDVGLNSLMKPVKLPAQSMAFNLVATALVLAARGGMYGYGLHPHVLAPPDKEADSILDYDFSTYAKEIKDNFTQQESMVQWSKVFEGSVIAAGQVFGVGNMMSSVIIWLAFFLYSPILTVAFYCGSVVGSALAAVINPGSLDEVYAGLWSFNSLLTSGGLSFFLQPSLHLVFVVIIGAAMTVFTQATIHHIFVITQSPVFSYPFNVVITLLLAIATQKGTTLTFIDSRSSPEQHFYEKITGIFEEDEEKENAPERRRFPV